MDPVGARRGVLPPGARSSRLLLFRYFGLVHGLPIVNRNGVTERLWMVALSNTS
jgi:hypothetical protein